MDSKVHTLSNKLKRMCNWYEKAQIDYADYYVRLYITYNAWYQEVTLKTNDREALSILKKRYVIWDDYIQGKTMKVLRPYMEQLVEVTQREPLNASIYWSGSLDSAKDWHSLIEFWYQVRCFIVHGTFVEPQYVWLAYETLNVFMGEIIQRIQACTSSKIPCARWQVDMHRVKDMSLKST